MALNLEVSDCVACKDRGIMTFHPSAEVVPKPSRVVPWDHNTVLHLLNVLD